MIFLILCDRNPVIYDDPAPLSSFQNPYSIKSLILALFNSVLGPNKIPRIRLANLGKNLSRGKNPYFHTKYSNGNILSFWYWNQVIQKPKFIYVSRTTTFIKDSKWDKFILNNKIAAKLNWKPSRGRILCFHARFKQKYLELLISKSSNSKAQIYLRVSFYNFNEGFKLR